MKSQWNQAPVQSSRADGRTANPAGYVPPLRGQIVSDWAGKEIPAREWICDEWIPVGQPTILAGDSGIGKTTLALQLAAAVAVGETWMGANTTRTQVLCVMCEDDPQENHRRMIDIATSLGLGLEDLQGVEIIVPDFDDENEDDPSLMQYDQYTGVGTPTLMYTRILRRALERKARIVILDTLTDFFGGNENIKLHVAQFMRLMRKMALEINGSVVICAHPSRAGLATGTGESGSVTWKAKCRSFLYLVRDNDDDGSPSNSKRVLRKNKANYSALDEIKLEWTNGVYTPLISSFPDKVDRIEAAGRARDILLFGLDKLNAQGRTTSSTRTASNFLPRLLRSAKLAGGLSEPALAAAMEDCFSRGLIKIGDAGRHANGSKKSGIVRA